MMMTEDHDKTMKKISAFISASTRQKNGFRSDQKSKVSLKHAKNHDVQADIKKMSLK